MQGPNVKKLIATRMAQLMIPDGGGFEAGLKALSSVESIKKYAREATVWVEEALSLVRSAPNNPYGNDDERIAGIILEKIEDKKKSAHKWAKKLGYMCCLTCGIIQRRDGKNGPCKGPVKIGPRK